jgi:hypothetical protein
MRSFALVRRVARIALALLILAAPVFGQPSDTDLDDDDGLDVPSGKVRDPDEIQPPDAKPRAHDEIPFPDAKPRAHDEIVPQKPDLPAPDAP